MRSVVIDRFNGKPLTVLIEKDERQSLYASSRALRVLDCVNRILIEQVPSVRKKGGLLDRMTFVVIPNI